MKKLLGLFLIAFSACLGQASTKPNIVLIIADDMGADDCGPYGHEKVQTPYLNRLAAEGMRFNRAFVTTSSCSPSRASILTGRYPHQTGAEQLHWPLPADQLGFTERLRDAGYWTAAAGKWHLGNAAKAKFDLVNDKAAAIPATAAEEVKERMQKESRSNCTQWLATLRSRPKDKPFFVWLAASDPHRDYDPNTIPTPHEASDAKVPPYLPDTPEVRNDFARYYDEITRLDSYIGGVLDELQRQGVAENTMIVFITDNGRPFPRGKTSLYDSGIRTPLIVRWPGKIKPKTVSDSLVSSIDLAPTFLALAGAKGAPSFLGKDFSSLFGNPDAKVRDYIFAEHNWHDYEARSRAIRNERFKYIRHDFNDLPGTPPADAVRSPTFQQMRQLRDEGKLTPAQMVCFVKPRPKEELFDLQADPYEIRNLAGEQEYAPTLARLRTALENWGRETDDRVPATRTPDAADRELGTRLPGKTGYDRSPPANRKYLDRFR